MESKNRFRDEQPREQAVHNNSADRLLDQFRRQAGRLLEEGDAILDRARSENSSEFVRFNRQQSGQ